jgi:hypothetical protein
MKSFEDFKTDFTADCKAHSACQPEFKKVLVSENWRQLLAVIKANMQWCVNEGVITLQVLANVPDAELLAVDIYLNKNDLELNKQECELFNSTATLWGNSTATLRENSTATLRENSTATLRENSTATLWGNSTATLWENSTATLWENSTATLWENSTATLWGNSYIDIYEYGKAVSINDNSICRERSTGKIYLSNNKLEIVYVN